MDENYHPCVATLPKIDFSKIQYMKLSHAEIPKGNTDYIDYLDWDHVKYPVVWGDDHYGRKFITLKLICGKQKMMQTFFQRYTDGIGWAFADCVNSKPLLYSSGRLTTGTFEFLEELIMNGKVDIREWENVDLGNTFSRWLKDSNDFELKLYNNYVEKWKYIIMIKIIHDVLLKNTVLDSDLSLQISKQAISF